MSSLRRELEASLGRLEGRDLRRHLAAPCGVDFSSNDYLGLASDGSFRVRVAEELAKLPAACPASRLLRGNLPEHEDLERDLARFKGTESALLFSTGYQANLGVLTALVRGRDRVLSDELNHASIIDALRLSRAEVVIYSHLDTAAIERELAKDHAAGRTFVVTESLYSMEGDIAPLDRIADLTDEHDAALIVDDSHATGVYGDARGSGLLERFGIERRADAIVSTFGKALGFFGAFVAGPAVVTDWLVNRARSFIFTTAPPPAVIAGIRAALAVLEEHPERRATVLARADRLRSALRVRGMDCLASEGPIVPVMVRDNARAVRLAETLRDAGFDVRAIRPPSVPPGSARLRVSVHADHDEATIDALATAIASAFARSG